MDFAGRQFWDSHYSDVIMSTMASQITSFASVYSTIYLGADQRKHQSSASLAFVRGIHWSPVNSPHKGPVTRKMFPFDDVIISFWHWAWYMTHHSLSEPRLLLLIAWCISGAWYIQPPDLTVHHRICMCKKIHMVKVLSDVFVVEIVKAF